MSCILKGGPDLLLFGTSKETQTGAATQSEEGIAAVYDHLSFPLSMTSQIAV